MCIAPPRFSNYHPSGPYRGKPSLPARADQSAPSTPAALTTCMAVPICLPRAQGAPREGHPHPHSTPVALLPSGFNLSIHVFAFVPPPAMRCSRMLSFMLQRPTTPSPPAVLQYAWTVVREGGSIIHPFSRDVYFMDGTIALILAMHDAENGVFPATSIDCQHPFRHVASPASDVLGHP